MISYMESLKLQEMEKKFLDSIDLSPFLKSGRYLSSVMDEIEDAYGNEYIEEEYIFNNMDADDFYRYVKHRYPHLHINTEVEVDYQIY